MLGSTHWVEERLGDLPSKVAAFLYVDSSARARDFMADVSPGLAGGLEDRAHLHLIDLGEGDAEAAAAVAEHRVKLVQAGGLVHDFLGRLPGGLRTFLDRFGRLGQELAEEPLLPPDPPGSLSHLSQHGVQRCLSRRGHQHAEVGLHRDGQRSPVAAPQEELDSLAAKQDGLCPLGAARVHFA